MVALLPTALKNKKGTHAGRVHSLSESPFASMIRIRFYGCDLSSSSRKNTPAV